MFCSCGHDVVKAGHIVCSACYWACSNEQRKELSFALVEAKRRAEDAGRTLRAELRSNERYRAAKRAVLDVAAARRTVR